MLIKQLSIFVENKSGRLARITKLLGEKEINILALSIADTTDFGILRIIVTDADRAEEILKESGLTIKATEVIGISVEHTPGGLSRVLSVLSDNQLDIEYMYAFVGNSKQDAMVIIKVTDNQRALSVFSEHNVKVITKEMVNNM